MANLFGRRYLVQSYASTSNLVDLRKKYPSSIVLSPISPNSPAPHLSDAFTVLRKHEDDILRTFTSYAAAFAAQNVEAIGADIALPLSGIQFTGSDSEPPSPIRQHLREYAHDTKSSSCSAFVSNSGWKEGDFKSVADVARTARSGLHLNSNAVPSFKSLYREDGDESRPLNAYILDFYIHGQTHALVNANGIRKGDLWYMLQDFSLTLATIRTSIEEIFTSYSGTSSIGDEEPVGVDPAEQDLAGVEEEKAEEETGFQRPAGVSDGDWRVYELVRDATAEFDIKYRKIWA